MNNDLIKRSELKAFIKKHYQQTSQIKSILAFIDTAPAADNRQQGEWIDRMADKGYVECPFCHKQITGGDLNFCVKCGADMRGKE